MVNFMACCVSVNIFSLSLTSSTVPRLAFLPMGNCSMNDLGPSVVQSCSSLHHQSSRKACSQLVEEEGVCVCGGVLTNFLKSFIPGGHAVSVVKRALCISTLRAEGGHFLTANVHSSDQCLSPRKRIMGSITCPQLFCVEALTPRASG